MYFLELQLISSFSKGSLKLRKVVRDRTVKMPASSTAVCSQLSLNYLKITETEERYQSMTWISLESGERERNERTHANVKTMSYNVRLTWFYTFNPDKMGLFV